MENGLYFPAVAGVSAGALNALNYLSHQPGRAASINLRYRHDPRYFGPKAALRGGSLFGLKFMLYDVKKEVPYDEDTYRHGGMRMIAVATNVETGKPAYFEKGKTDFDFNEAVRASASLPLASTPVMLDGQPYLDGGCSCPIALNWALKQGFDKIVVVTTRQKGFRKSQPGQRMVDLYDDFYGDKPLFLATMTAFRQELRDLPIVLGELGYPANGFTSTPAALVTEFNRRLPALAAEMPNCCVVSAKALNCRGDGLHFDTPSLREFGRRYYRAWQELAKKH